MPVVLVGVVLISGVVGTGAYGANPALGVVLGVATALCYSGYLLVIRLGGRDPRRPAGPVAIATVGTALVAGRGRGRSSGDLDLAPPLASLGWLALLGVTSQSIGYLCISISLPRLPAVVTSIILLVQPVADGRPRRDAAGGAAVGAAARRGRAGHRRDRRGDGPAGAAAGQPAWRARRARDRRRVAERRPESDPVGASSRGRRLARVDRLVVGSLRERRESPAFAGTVVPPPPRRPSPHSWVWPAGGSGGPS